MPALPWIIGLLGVGGTGGFFAGGGFNGIGNIVKWASVGFGLYLLANHFKWI